MTNSADTLLPFPEWSATASTTANSPTISAKNRTDEAETLICRAREGSRDAYDAFVLLFQDRIFRFCFNWVGDTHDAEELCQDTFVRAYSALPRYESMERTTAWLYRIARNLCHDHHRSLHRRNTAKNQSIDSVDTAALICRMNGPDERTMQSETLGKIQLGITKLPPSLREVIVLCGIEGLSYDATAQILKCSRRAVEGRLRRARMQLTEWCEKEKS